MYVVNGRNVFIKLISVIFCIFAFFAVSAMAPHCAWAVSTEARKDTDRGSVIEALRLFQIGSSQMVIELRGVNLSQPRAIASDSALSLLWAETRFPRSTDRKEWWDEFEWDVLRIDSKKSNEWRQSYDYPLVSDIRVSTVTESGQDGMRMDITGPKHLIVKDISGIKGTGHLRIMLETEPDIAPPQPPKPRPRPAGDPLAITAPVTIEARGISLRELFSILAKQRKLNYLLDPSVPDTHITLSFHETPFNEIFAYLLRMNNLSYSLAGKTIFIGTADSLGKTLGLNRQREYSIDYADIKTLSKIITAIIPLQNKPEPDEQRRKVYITATPEQHRRIEALINRLDHPGQQVMIEARLIEISDSAEQEIESMIAAVYNGWISSFSSSGLSTRYTYGNGSVTSNVDVTGTTTQGSLPIVGGGSDTTFPVSVVDSTVKMLDAGLRAMESDNKGKVLASPAVTALDGQKATVKLTHNYLYQSGVDENGNPEFSEQETGPTLEFTPKMGRDGYMTIKMKISTGEIVSFRESGDSEAPETTVREVETQVRVRNGEPFVIGGLYQESKTNSTTRVPVLGYIPILGELFKTRSVEHSKSQMAFVAIPYTIDIQNSSAQTIDLPAAELYQ